MKTRTITIYSFSELSPEAQQAAMDSYASVHGYSFSDEALASLRALAAHFGGKLKDYSIDFFACSHSSADFKMPQPEEMDRAAIQARLDTLGTFDPVTLKGNGDCKLTGYCMDEDAIDGFRYAFAKGESDLSELMESAFRSWLRSAQDDCQASYTAGVFAEHADANGYEYTEDGRAA